MNMEMGNCKEGNLVLDLCKYYKIVYECVGMFDTLAKSLK
jgi:hypothetical protein